MTHFQYTSRAPQLGLDRDECVAAAESIVALLERNAVLDSSVLSLHKMDGVWLLDMTASVEANADDRAAIFMVLFAADEQFQYALRESDCSPEITSSALKQQEYLV